MVTQQELRKSQGIQSLIQRKIQEQQRQQQQQALIELQRQQEQQPRAITLSDIQQQIDYYTNKAYSTSSDIESNKNLAKVRLLKQIKKLPSEQITALDKSGQLSKLLTKAGALAKGFSSGEIKSVYKNIPNVSQVEEELKMSLPPEFFNQYSEAQTTSLQSLTPNIALQKIQTQPYSQIPTYTITQQVPEYKEPTSKVGKFVSNIYGQMASLGGQKVIYSETGNVAGIESVPLRQGGLPPELIYASIPGAFGGSIGTSVGLKSSGRASNFYENYIRDIPKGIKRATVGVEKEIIVPTRGYPITQQYVLSNPNIRKLVIQESPGIIQAEGRGVSMVLSETDIGLMRVRQLEKAGKLPKILSSEPIRLYSGGVTYPETGLYQNLPKRQAEIFTKRISDSLLGREFSRSFSKGYGTSGIKMSDESFLSATEFTGGDIGTGRSFNVKGISKIKLKKPSKIQRTGKVFGYMGEIRVGKIKVGDEIIPISEAEGIIGFNPLYKPGKVSLEKVKTFVIGNEAETKMLAKVSESLPQILKPNKALQIYKQSLKTPTTKELINQLTKVKGANIGKIKTPKIIIKSNGENIGTKEITIPLTTSTINLPKESYADNVIEKNRRTFSNRLDVRQLTKELTDTQTQLNLRNIQTQIPDVKDNVIERVLQRSLIMEEQQQDQLQIQRQKVKDNVIERVFPNVTNIPTPIIKPPILIPTKIPIPFNDVPEKILKSFNKSYRLLIKRFGKYKPIAELPRGKALQLGSEITKKTLAASFKIEPTGRTTKIKDIEFKLNPKIFRTYKIRKGRKVPLVNEFIQKRGTRLSSKSEVSEILGFKKRKRRKR